MFNDFNFINFNMITYGQFILITYFIIIWLIYLLIQPYSIYYKFDQKSKHLINRSNIKNIPQMPQPPKPPKKNWKEKIKEHLYHYKEIYIGSCILIISTISIMYYYDLSFYDFFNFFKNRKSPEGGDSLNEGNPFEGRPVLYHGDRSYWHHLSSSVLSIPSLSNFTRSENMNFMCKYVENFDLGFTRILLDQIKAGLIAEATYVTEVIGTTLSQDQLNPIIDNIRSDLILSEQETSSDINNRDLTEFMMADVIAQNPTAQLMYDQSDRYLDNLNTQISTDIDRYLSDWEDVTEEKPIEQLMSDQSDRYLADLNTQMSLEIDTYLSNRISEETNRYLTESMLEETNALLTDAIFREALNYQEETLGYNNLNVRSTEQYTNFVNTLFQRDLTSEEFDSLVYNLISPENTVENPSLSLEQRVPQIAMTDIRFLQEQQYSELSCLEIIDLLIFEEIGTPTPLKDLLENGQLTELGYEMLEEETRLISRKFRNTVLNLIIESLLQRTDLTDSIQLNELILNYMEKSQLMYADPTEFDYYIEKIHHALIYEDPFITNYLNSLESEELQAVESEIIYRHIAATILNQYMQYTGFPSGVPTYHEMINIIQLYLVLQHYFEFPDLNTVQLLALGRAY